MLPAPWYHLCSCNGLAPIRGRSAPLVRISGCGHRPQVEFVKQVPLKALLQPSSVFPQWTELQGPRIVFITYHYSE